MSTTAESAVSTGSAYKQGLNEFLPRLSIAFFICALLLVSGEGISYLILKYQTPSQKEMASPPASVYKDQALARRLWPQWQASRAEMQYKAFVVWRGEPFKSEMVNVDAEGLRSTYYTDCIPGAYTIWMFGNSTFWGMGEPDWGTLPSLIAQKYEKSGQKVCVINYAESGWVCTQELVQLMLALKSNPQKPDLVVFYDGVPDVFLPYETDKGDVHGNYERMTIWFKEASALRKPGFEYLRKTNTYRLLQIIAAKLSNGSAQEQIRVRSEHDANAVAQKTYESYTKNMDIAEALGQRFGFRCAFFWQPTTLVGPKPLTPEEEKVNDSAEHRNPGIRLVFDSIYRMARNIKRPGFYYLGDIFKDHSERLFIDITHVGPEANSVIAENMFRSLQTIRSQRKDEGR